MARKVKKLSVVLHKQTRVLELLSRGMSVSEAMRAIGYKGVNSYYNWRKSSKDFKTRADSIIAMREEMPGGKLVQLDDRRLHAFLKIFREQGNRNRALVTANISATLVEALLDEDGAEYDQSFAIRYRDIELRHMWEIEDNTVLDSKSNPGTNSRFVLQARMSRRYNKPLHTSMATAGDRMLQQQQNVFFFQIGENDRTAGDILNGVFDKFKAPLEIGESHGRHDVQDQEARPDLPAVDVSNG